jgi:hypothetical protein
MMKQKKILTHILEKHAPSVKESKPLQKKSMSSFEEPSFAESKLIPSLDSTVEPLPEARTLKERVIHHSEFTIEFEDYGNTSKFLRHEKLTHLPKEVPLG